MIGNILAWRAVCIGNRITTRVSALEEIKINGESIDWFNKKTKRRVGWGSSACGIVRRRDANVRPT